MGVLERICIEFVDRTLDTTVYARTREQRGDEVLWARNENLKYNNSASMLVDEVYVSTRAIPPWAWFLLSLW